jgi:hypothetical protein
VPRIVVDTAPALAAKAEGLRLDNGAARIVKIAPVVTVPPSGNVTFKMYVPGEAAPCVTGFSGVTLTGTVVAVEFPVAATVKCVPSVVFVAVMMMSAKGLPASNEPFSVSATEAGGLPAVSVIVAVDNELTDGAALTLKAFASV